MKVMILAHPINEKCFEVLFANDSGSKFVTVDGLSQNYIEREMGYTVNMVRSFSNCEPLPYAIMAKALAEKLLYLSHHVKYKDELEYLRRFQKIGARICLTESIMGWDLDIPECVITLVNTPLRKGSKTCA